MKSGSPTLEVERSYLSEGYRFIAGMDEVGRGALAGPVTVGCVMIDAAASPHLPQVKDSKLLTSSVRESLVAKIQAWCSAFAVGHASAQEVDALGVTGALRLAGQRAWWDAAEKVRADVVILDGSHDWLSTPREATLMDEYLLGEEAPAGLDVPVHARVKADMTCLSVAAASVLAKVARDALMVELDRAEPWFGWRGNKGYGTVGHRAAIAERGPSEHHRKTWNLLPSV